MARTIQAIKQQMTVEFLSEPSIRAIYKIDPSVPNDGFESVFSKVSIENIIFYIVAFGIHILERIFYTEKEKLTQYVESLRPHTEAWYVNKLKSFQLGYALNKEGGYDIIDVEAQIIKYCSLRRANGILEFRIANDAGGVPQIINENDISSINNYAIRVFDAGTHFRIFSSNPDIYRCNLLINYDPLVLDSKGKRIDGTNDTPVIDAINSYFRSFPFDSEFSNMALAHAIEKVEGVRIVQLTGSWATPPSLGEQVVISTYISRSGYMAFNEVPSAIEYVIK
ncbi:MAG: hypothetical protein FWC34_11165 [Bacteroidetes bacterium]|nr:hypothetical protein [Bacteroidota bacterium]MCL2302898.1 hypothetical protein [Lentimicrobiaceae bacterium]